MDYLITSIKIIFILLLCAYIKLKKLINKKIVDSNFITKNLSLSLIGEKTNNQKDESH